MLPSPDCRYSRKRRTPSTTPSTCQLASNYQACQFLPSCESFNKLTRLPQAHATTRAHTQHGQEKIPNSIMIVIIIIISIR